MLILILIYASEQCSYAVNTMLLGRRQYLSLRNRHHCYSCCSYNKPHILIFFRHPPHVDYPFYRQGFRCSLCSLHCIPLKNLVIFLAQFKYLFFQFQHFIKEKGNYGIIVLYTYYVASASQIVQDKIISDVFFNIALLKQRSISNFSACAIL